MQVLPNTLEQARAGRAALRQLVSMAKARCLTDREFDRLTAKAQDGFEAVLGKDPHGPDTPTFHVVNGGRK